jgi:GNAT superfamily N-acetyltransferase
MSLKIRLATMADLPVLQRLIPESVRALSVSYYNSRQIESALAHIFGVDSQLIQDGTYFVAESGSQIVGCGGWSKRAALFGSDQTKREQVDQLLDPANDAARIRAFYVHPKWSRQGIASQLVSSCEEAARAAGFQRMELAATLPGEPLYTALGYIRAEGFDLRTPDGESVPVYHMRKDLGAADRSSLTAL